MKRTLFLLLAIASFKCREKYNAVFDTPSGGFLVVEGFINYGGITQINLSRTSPLDTRTILYEKNAVVQVEGDNNSVFLLSDADSGRYVGSQLPLNITSKYRIRIKTANQREYLSDFRSVITTPPIDSLTWKRNNGVEIFINSSPPANNSRYYRWETEETWEFKSKYEARLYYIYDILPNGSKGYTDVGKFFPDLGFKRNEEMFTCWKTVNSSGILLGTTTKLDQNILYSMIKFYPENAWELSFLYSIYVKQYGMSKEGYDFYQKMKKNTEALGSIFDAQPSELKGNITCISHPGELVIGFVEASSVEDKRIFISVNELPGWNYQAYCKETKAIPNNPDSLAKAAEEDFLPSTVIIMGDYPPYRVGILSVTDKVCTDCRELGSSIKPAFWP